MILALIFHLYQSIQNLFKGVFALRSSSLPSRAVMKSVQSSLVKCLKPSLTRPRKRPVVRLVSRPALAVLRTKASSFSKILRSCRS